ncbi:hypothetical protein [Xanthomonas oryzae]|uniref:hypothetical protein n=1 Tax=Xanthomonas oryzae TaxID=347 RepID=UPI000CA06B32|nr:hypothetical protein BO993_24140 [Xanthomonas oryzae pv. oryzae]
MNSINFPEDEVSFDDEANAAAALGEKLADAGTPGFQAEFDPEEATRAGAFVEDALSEQDAAASGDDLVDLAERQERRRLADDAAA